MAKKAVEPQSPVVLSVFEDFLQRFASDPKIDKSVVDRLRKALIDDQQSTADALGAALFSEDVIP
jgi:hypothetical protein